MELRETLKQRDTLSSHEVPRVATRDELPLLDLADLQNGGSTHRLAAQLRTACLGMGFLYVANHGVPKDVIDDMFEASRGFFTLPVEEKRTVKVDDRFYRGFLEQGINQHPGYAPDLKESFEFAFDLPPDHPDVTAGLPLHGPNQWPQNYPLLRRAGEAYFDAAIELGRNLLRLFASSLQLEETYFSQYYRSPMVTCRLFHYPPQQAMSRSDAFGVAPHTDYGAVTILAQDPIGGLELKTRDGQWVGAPYIDDTLIINLGDLFRVWTNDVYVSNPHRVVNRTGRERYSVPIFFNPDFRALISCIPTCQSAEQPPKYQPVVFGDYFMGRYRATQKYKGPQAGAATEEA
jgi:isopenicillin N synthase-like dioxygenase